MVHPSAEQQEQHAPSSVEPSFEASLVGTCKLLGIDPNTHLCDVLLRAKLMGIKRIGVRRSHSGIMDDGENS
jgi:hypothetical protein